MERTGRGVRGLKYVGRANDPSLQNHLHDKYELVGDVLLLLPVLERRGLNASILDSHRLRQEDNVTLQNSTLCLATKLAIVCSLYKTNVVPKQPFWYLIALLVEWLQVKVHYAIIDCAPLPKPLKHAILDDNSVMWFPYIVYGINHLVDLLQEMAQTVSCHHCAPDGCGLTD